jgi:putative hemolysin
MQTGHVPPGGNRSAARLDPFQLAPRTPLVRAALGAARPFLSAFAGLPALRDAYAAVATTPGETFEERVLGTLGVRFGIDAGEKTRIPATGPLIVAANHPTGALDGIVLTEVVRQVRTDVRVLANHLLRVVPELHGSCFFVDPFGGPGAAGRSRGGLRAAHLWLRRGGALVMFPAGEVASVRRANLQDAPWHPTIGRLAAATGAHVLPVFIDGENSRLFYAAGRVHPLLRTLLLGRELLRKRGTTMPVRIGTAVAPAEVVQPDGPCAVAVTTAARSAVDDLARRSTSAATVTPVADATDPGLLEAEVAALPSEAHLLASGSFDVYHASAGSIPGVVREIGRLREIAFRQAGEGTGQPLDLDRFDDHYTHLFVWQRDRREVVGAYRVGATDRVVVAHGVSGLYTSTLFRYDERLIDRIGPALELGRAFVRPQYRRSHSALLLLWKGIGRLVAQSLRYRVLFGPVSISSRYQDVSQHLLRAFLAEQHGDAALAALVDPVNPPPMPPPARRAARPADAAELDALIASIEGGEGIPVLLRQYLRLQATLIGFNIDPAFGDALDALMMVDLIRLPESLLRRYLDRDGAAAFLRWHRDASRSAA